MDIAFLLIALGLGYKIFAEADASPKRHLQTLGYILGILILAVSGFQLFTQLQDGSPCKMKRMMPGSMQNYGQPPMGPGGNQQTGSMDFQRPPMSSGQQGPGSQNRRPPQQ